jgi:predicted RNase H-like HicB family nuclease
MNTKYEIIISWIENDSSFIAEVPELSGCMADGLTCQEALSNVSEVIDNWIDTAKSLNRVIPNPKGKLMNA